MQVSTLGQHEKGQVNSSDKHKAKTKSKGTQSEGFRQGLVIYQPIKHFISFYTQSPGEELSSLRIITMKNQRSGATLDTKMRTFSTLTYFLLENNNVNPRRSGNHNQSKTNSFQFVCCFLISNLKIFLCSERYLGTSGSQKSYVPFPVLIAAIQ